MLLFRFRRQRRTYRSYHQHQMGRAKNRLFKLGLILVGLLVAHSVAMVWLEGLDWWQAFWLSMTTASTTGYGDISAATPAGQTATIVLMYASGIAVLAQFFGDYVEYRTERKRLKRLGHWEWNMRDHILIINTPSHDRERYLTRLVEQIRKTPELEGRQIQVLCDNYPDGLPERIQALDVVHYHGAAEHDENLRAAGAHQARYIYVVAADAEAGESDAMNFDVLHRLRDLGCMASIICECVEDRNRNRLRAIGAQAVLRPARAYPELVVRALVAPGTEQVLENLFTHHDDHLERFDLAFHGSWADIACAVICADQGTPIGFIDLEGSVITHPKANDKVSGKALLLLVDDDNIPRLPQLQGTLSPFLANHPS